MIYLLRLWLMERSLLKIVVHSELKYVYRNVYEMVWQLTQNTRNTLANSAIDKLWSQRYSIFIVIRIIDEKGDKNAENKNI